MFLVRSHRDCDDLEGHCLHCDAFDGFPTPYEQTGTVAPSLFACFERYTSSS